MNLKQYLGMHQIKPKEFALKIGCTYNYLMEVLNGRKPGIKLIKAISKATKGQVDYLELLGQQNVTHKQKQKQLASENYTCTPPENMIRTKRKHNIFQNIPHCNSFKITVLVNDQILISEIFNENEKKPNSCQNYEYDNVKLDYRIISHDIHDIPVTHNQETPSVLA